MLYRPSFWILLLIALGWSVFQVKYEVQQKETTLLKLNREIARTESDIRILKAEWSHLTEAGRLEQQNAAFLHLVPIAPQQIYSLHEAGSRVASKQDQGGNKLGQNGIDQNGTNQGTGNANIGLDQSALAQLMQADRQNAPNMTGKGRQP